jgi:acyl-CoA thioester hydrolase
VPSSRYQRGWQPRVAAVPAVDNIATEEGEPIRREAVGSQTGVSHVKEHETTIRVRYEDADPMGFLHHSKYFSYFEIGRTELFRASGGDYRQMEQSGLYVVVVKAECRFVRPARYDDLITVRTKLVKISMAKIEHEYIAMRDADVLAKAQVTLAVVDGEGKVQPVPRWIEELY